MHIYSNYKILLIMSMVLSVSFFCVLLLLVLDSAAVIGVVAVAVAVNSRLGCSDRRSGCCCSC